MRDVSTCTPEQTAGALARLLQERGEDICVVVNQNNVVLGRVRRRDLEGDPSGRVDDVMDADIATIRPDAKLQATVEAFQKRKGRSFLVTTPEGVLQGILHREDAEQRLHELHGEG